LKIRDKPLSVQTTERYIMTENLIEGTTAAAMQNVAGPQNSVAAPDSNGVPASIDAGDMLNQSLGLDKIESDPNAIPDGRYDCVVVSAEKVHIASKNGVAVVITYKLVDGDYKDARIPHFFNLGVNPVFDDQGKIVSFTPTASEGQLRWFKKAFVDLGIPEHAVRTTKLSDLVGRECTVGVRKKDGYRNVNFVEPRGNSLPQQVQQPATAQSAQSATAQPVQNAQGPTASSSEMPPF